jgi:multidrug efflux pump subunit AcrB
VFKTSPYGARCGGAAPPADDAAGRAGTLALTVYLYIVVPKGFFPVQDTGVILGISKRRRRFRFAAMASASRRWPRSS